MARRPVCDRVTSRQAPTFAGLTGKPCSIGKLKGWAAHSGGCDDVEPALARRRSPSPFSAPSRSGLAKPTDPAPWQIVFAHGREHFYGHRVIKDGSAVLRAAGNAPTISWSRVNRAPTDG